MSQLADDTRWLDGVDQAALVESGEVTPAELLEAAIERMEALDPVVHALTITWFDHARELAADPALPTGPLRGVPFLLKDLFAPFAGQRSSNGNVALRDAGMVDRTDSTLVSRYRAAGLVVAGRTASPELGTLPTTQPVAWGATRNPWDLSRTAGGSSGGAAAAVASGMVPLAHASDGGGSIRVPASVCGLVGLKPSQGRISAGPWRSEAGLGVEHCVSRTVRDSAALLDAVAGPGVGDAVVAPPPERPYADELEAHPGRLRVGLMDVHPRGEALHEDCVTGVRAAATLLEELGHHVEPAWPEALADSSAMRGFMALWLTQAALARAELAETLGRPVTEADLEPLNWLQAERGSALSALDLARAQEASQLFRRRVQSWWASGFDLLLTPTLAEPPLPLEVLKPVEADPYAQMRPTVRWLVFTPAFNLTGQPAVSLPLHEGAGGLPVGVQLVAAYGREDMLLRVAAQLETARPWADRRPPVAA